jgi:hypothetical protein
MREFFILALLGSGLTATASAQPLPSWSPWREARRLFGPMFPIFQVRVPGPGGASPGSGGSWPPTIVSITGPATPSPTGGVSNALNTTGANFIGLGMAFNNSGTLTVKDCVGASYSSCGGTSTNIYTCLAIASSTGAIYTQLCYVLNATVGSSHYFSVTSSVTTAVQFGVWASNSIKTSGAYNSDQAGSNNCCGTATSPGPDSPTSGHTLHIAFDAGNASSGGTCTIGSSFTNMLFAPQVTGGYAFCGGTLAQSSGTAQTPTLTISTLSSSRCCCLLKAHSTCATPRPPPWW